MNTAPLKHSLSVTGLLLAGAAGGIAGVTSLKYVAPQWFGPAAATASLPPATTQPVALDTPKPSTATAPVKITKASPKPPVISPQETLTRQHHLVGQLQLCRAQLELYKLQHHDKLPDFAKHLWTQLTQATRGDGTPDPRGSCGPYLTSIPTNPLNGFASLGLIKKDPAPGQVMPASKLGYVFCSATGHLFATAADGKTIFDESTYVEPPLKENKPQALKSQLLELRANVELYKLQHVDLPPDFAHSPMWEQLTRRTRSNGAFDLRGFGPYMPHRPVNILNGFSKVEVVANVPPGYKTTTPQIGYIFDTATGRLYATDEHGGLFKE